MSQWITVCVSSTDEREALIVTTRYFLRRGFEFLGVSKNTLQEFSKEGLDAFVQSIRVSRMRKSPEIFSVVADVNDGQVYVEKFAEIEARFRNRGSYLEGHGLH